MEKKLFTEPLLDWYDANKREMAWRDQKNPYYTWISEIMLQQTRIEAAKEYFNRFILELPDIRSLAEVSEERLMKLWEGLGYYSRARNLKKAAEILVVQYEGELPKNYEELITLPGVGPYTAGAIASIAYNQPEPAVDGNVLRVVMRYLAREDDIMKMSVRKEVANLLRCIMPERPGDFNQGIMELGEVICIPNGAPLCEQCPLQGSCQAYREGNPEKYPAKVEKKPRRIEKRSVVIYTCDGKYGIAKRPGKGLLAGLYEFPSLDRHVTKKTLQQYLEEQNLQGGKLESLGSAKHIFSHVEWHMKGYLVEIEKNQQEHVPGEVVFVTEEELVNTYTLPVAFHYYLEAIQASRNMPKKEGKK